jgi:hypothetical protein
MTTLLAPLKPSDLPETQFDASFLTDRIWMNDTNLDSPESEYDAEESDWDVEAMVASESRTYAAPGEGRLISSMSLSKPGKHLPAVDVDFPVRLLIDHAGWTWLVEAHATEDALERWPGGELAFRLPHRHGESWALSPSSTEGHFHLYGSVPVTHGAYMTFLAQLAAAEFVGPKWLALAETRGFTCLRAPGVKKVLFPFDSDEEEDYEV